MQSIIRFIYKSFKIVCFWFVPFILLAGGSKADFETSSLRDGTCSFDIEGKMSFHLDGIATFENSIEEDKFCNTTEKLLLRFVTCDDAQLQTLEFIIASKKKGNYGVQSGTYSVQNIDRLMKSFSGVFGFADMGGLSELPFFVKSGNIIIADSYANMIDGRLEVQLENTKGEALYINGSFNAEIKV